MTASKTDRTADVVTIDMQTLPNVSGVLGSRAFAWLGDFVVLVILGWIVFLLLGMLGLVTFGLTWLLMPVAAVATILGYAAITIGGDKQATLGMRMAGLKVEKVDGTRPDGLAAAVHALMFYVAAGSIGLLALSVGIGLMRADRRMGHDLLAGLVVVRR